MRSTPEKKIVDSFVGRMHYEYYIIENDVSLLLKKRPCLDSHYKYMSI